MAIVSLLLAAALASAPPALDPCNDLSDIDPTAPARTINLTDLTELTDFGGSDTADVSGVFGVSPNGRQLAVVTRRANPATNSYCMRLLVMPSDGSSPLMRSIAAVTSPERHRPSGPLPQCHKGPRC
jgi:hypothetical protein